MSESSDSTCSDPGANLIPNYCPYIADVPITKKSRPFPRQQQPVLSESEYIKKKKKYEKYIRSSSFNSPLPLKDFMIIANRRWETDNLEEPSAGCDAQCTVV